MDCPKVIKIEDLIKETIKILKETTDHNTSDDFEIIYDHLSDKVLLAQVFKCLSLKELFNCRLVCKKWKNCVDSIELHELIIKDVDSNSIQSIDSTSKTWYNIEREFDDRNTIFIKNPYKFDFLPFNLKKLKRLHFCDQLLCPVDLESIGCSNLRHLEIHNLDNSIQITFPQLEILSIYLEQSSCFSRKFDFKIEIDCPNLKAFSCANKHRSLKCIKIKHPESIRCLEFYSGAGLNFDQFENVTVVHCFRPFLNPDMLRSLKRKLKRFCLFGSRSYFLTFLNEVDVRADLDQIFKIKERNQLNDLQIFFFNHKTHSYEVIQHTEDPKLIYLINYLLDDFD